MNTIEKTNRQTETLKKTLNIFMKLKNKMGEEKFNKLMDKLAKKTWKN